MKATILLVDDEPDLASVVALRLKAAGYEVVLAHDGQTALEKARQLMPQLIILDLMLPKLDGYKVCRLLKYDKKYQEIPILIFTARAMMEDMKNASDCGADGYLTKPFEASVLLQKIDRLLKMAHPGAQAEGRAGESP